MFNQTVANEAPYTQAGYGAQSELNYLLGIPGYENINQPSYNGPGGGPNGNGGYGGYRGYAGPGGYGGIGVGGYGYTPGAGVGGSGMVGATPSGTAPAGYSSAAGGYGSLLTPFNASNFQQLSPAYQFQLQQGQQGTLNGDASSVGALSGAAQKDLMSYNQGLANTSFNTAFNQYQTQQGNIYSRLAGVAQTGQAAASNQATGASNFGASIGQQAANVGAAQAGGIVGATNAITGGIQSALPWLVQAGNSTAGIGSSLGFTGGG
jgi:hypothetical protein